MAKTKLGLVGAGKIAREQHVPVINSNSAFELIAAADTNRQLEGVANFGALETMLATAPIEAVVLCTPPDTRAGLATTALRAGKHVLLEKPPGIEVRDVEALATLARASKLALCASWHSRHNDAVAFARRWLSGKRLLSGAIVWKEDVRVSHPDQDWIFAPGGFGVFDTGINALSIVTDILAEPPALETARLFTPANRGQPIAAFLQLKSAAGARIAADFDFEESLRPERSITLHTDTGVLALTEGGRDLLVDGATGSVQQGSLRSEYIGVYSHFAECIGDARIDVDLAPLQLVADAFAHGTHETVGPFEF